MGDSVGLGARNWVAGKINPLEEHDIDFSQLSNKGSICTLTLFYSIQPDFPVFATYHEQKRTY